MSNSGMTYSVFTKPWNLSMDELGEKVSKLGFDGIELPVRPGFAVTPEEIKEKLPEAVKTLAKYGVKITSVAGNTDELTISACGDNGISLIRTMVYVGEENYLEVEARTQKQYEELIPLLDKHGVKLGLQNHCDAFVCNAMGIKHLIEKFDPKYIGAVWDCAHNALNGEDPEMGLDIVWSHLCMINFKNAYWKVMNGPESDITVWQHYWTTGKRGRADWARIAANLKKRNWSGTLCITNEYSDEANTDKWIAEDIAYAKSLFE